MDWWPGMSSDPWVIALLGPDARARCTGGCRVEAQESAFEPEEHPCHDCWERRALANWSMELLIKPTLSLAHYRATRYPERTDYRLWRALYAVVARQRARTEPWEPERRVLLRRIGRVLAERAT